MNQLRKSSTGPKFTSIVLWGSCCSIFSFLFSVLQISVCPFFFWTFHCLSCFWLYLGPSWPWSYVSYTPTHIWVGAILQSPCPSVRPFVRPSVLTFVTDLSASIGRIDFIFDIWLWHGDLYRVSPFQVYRTSTSCLPFDLLWTSGGILSTT